MPWHTTTSGCVSECACVRACVCICVDRVLYTVINIDSLQYTKGKIGTTHRAALSSLTDSNIFPQVAYASIVNHSASVEAYRRATQHNPTFPKAYYNMALELQAQGLLEEAVAASTPDKVT